MLEVLKTYYVRNTIVEVNMLYILIIADALGWKKIFE
jgi:hypothetical protein